MSTDSPSSLMPVDPPFAVYRDQLTALSHGLALWNPSPPKKIYNNVAIGDVGYLHEGKFIRVFNVTLPWNHPSNGLLGKLEPYDPLDCGQFTYTIEDDFDKVDHYSRFVTAKTNAGNPQAKTPADMEGVTYKCRSRGALLSLPNGGRREDVIRTKVFEEYIRDHVDSWFNWTQNNKLGVERMEDLILVSGCTLVTSWAAAAFVDNTCDAEVSLASRSLSNVGASFVWGNVQGRVSYHNNRFDPQNPPTMADQCVFIRGFRAKRILFWTRRIRAAAEPRPDDPDNRREDEIQVSRVAGAPKYRDPLVGVLDYIVEKCQTDNVEEGVLAIAHHDDLQFIKDVETLTADTIEEFLHGEQMPLSVENGAAILHCSADNEHTSLVNTRDSPTILRDPPETNQMTTTERNGGRFRWERGLHLFRRMTWARFASSLGIRNSPTIPTPIPSNEPYLASLVASSQPEPPHPVKTAQTNHQASKSSLDGSHQKSSIVSSFHDSNGKHARTPVQDNRKTVTTSTSSSRPRAITLSRALSQDWESSQRHRDGTDYLPSFGDALASQGPRSQEASPQKKRLPPSGRMSRMNSENLFGNGHAPQIGPFPTPGAGQMPVEGQESRSRFPSALQSLLPNDVRFRILVVGKRDSGKSSLIKTIFKVDMSGTPINISGRTAEFRPRDNRYLTVHECSASGPGEMQAIRDFVTTRNHKSRPASERLHAIWACIPMSDVIHGQVDKEVKMLSDIGVPFVIVFTKFDLIIPDVSSSHNDYEERCRSLFGSVPTSIVSMQPKFRHFIYKLVTTTDGVIIAQSRKIAASSEAQRVQPRMSLVPLAWSVSQRASHDINIQTATEVGRSKYWRGLWSSDDFRGQTLANCIEVIHADIVGVWNLPDKDRYISSKAFREEVSYLVQDYNGSPTTPSGSKPNGTGAPWLTNHYENSKEKICLVVGYIVDLTLILCRVFRSPGNLSPGEVQSVINNFASSSLRTSIHNDISNFIRTVPQLQYHNNDVVMAKIGDLLSRYSTSG